MLEAELAKHKKWRQLKRNLNQEVTVAELKIDIAPASWQLTATTINCDMVSDYVTIMVYRDWACKCTWWEKYKKVAGAEPRHKFSREIKKKMGMCQGPDCKYGIGYRDKLIGEEADAKK